MCALFDKCVVRSEIRHSHDQHKNALFDGDENEAQSEYWKLATHGKVSCNLIDNKHEGKPKGQSHADVKPRGGASLWGIRCFFTGIRTRWSIRGFCRRKRKNNKAEQNAFRQMSLLSAAISKVYNETLMQMCQGERRYCIKSVVKTTRDREGRGVRFWFFRMQTGSSPFQESSNKPTPSGMVMASAVPHSRPAPRMDTN